MFGPRLSQIFASRWMALWWSASILFLAWQLVPSADDDDSTSDARPAASAAVNPWAINPAGSGQPEKSRP